MELQISVIRALKIAFNRADNDTERHIGVLEISLLQIKNIMIENRLCQDSLSIELINKCLKEFGFTNGGKLKIIMRDYLDNLGV